MKGNRLEGLYPKYLDWHIFLICIIIAWSVTSIFSILGVVLVHFWPILARNVKNGNILRFILIVNKQQSIAQRNFATFWLYFCYNIFYIYLLLFCDVTTKNPALTSENRLLGGSVHLQVSIRIPVSPSNSGICDFSKFRNAQKFQISKFRKFQLRKT